VQQQEQPQLGRSQSIRLSLGSSCKAQTNNADQQQQQQQLCGSPSRRISTNSSPRRPGSSAVIRRTSAGARPKSPDTNGSSPLNVMRRSSGQLSPRSSLSGSSPVLRRSSTACLKPTAEQGGPLVVDEISVAVDDIIRQKMDAAWVVVCERFNIPYDGKTLSSQSSSRGPFQSHAPFRRQSVQALAARGSEGPRLLLQQSRQTVRFSWIMHCSGQ